MLELYHYEPYANSMKCLICLEEKRLAFESRYVDILRFEQHAAAFVKINPNGQVPVLIHDGKTIVESTVINEYLDEVFPKVPLRPSDPVTRARMRVWSKWVDEVLMQSVSMLGWQVRFRPLAQSIGKAEFAERMKRVPLKEIREKMGDHGRAGILRSGARGFAAQDPLVHRADGDDTEREFMARR